jgi:hypothetical protein
MLKKITALFLIVALMVNLIGYFVIFQCNRFVLRFEMAEQIRSVTPGNLETIKIPISSPDRNLVFSDKNEFFYHGLLYDMVTRVISHDTITYTCIQDKNEQNLLDEFSQFLNQDPGSPDTKNSNPVLALILDLVNQALIQKTISPKPSEVRDFVFPVLTCHISEIFLPVVCPPPKAG